MIYRLLRKLTKIGLFFFFKKIVVSGRKNLIEEGPLIVVANHPNTLMDPLIISSLMKQQIGFLGNAGLFSNRFFGSILKYFNVIPVFRKKDIAKGEKPDNKYSFSKCHENLDEKGTILIFPEGSSYYELKLREIKTGTARIALSYKSLSNFDLNLKILPIALDYSDAIQFRSIVSVTIGEPILLEPYKQTFLNNELEAVLELTKRIHFELEKHIPNTTSKEQEQFLLKSHKFYATFNDAKTKLYSNPKQSLNSRAQISKFLNILREKNIALYNEIEKNMHLFFDKLSEENLTPGFFTESFLNKNKIVVYFSYFIKFLLFAPIYTFGIIINYVPYILPSLLFKFSKLDIEYKTSFQMIAGLFIFPLLYWLEIKLIGSYFNIGFWGFCLFVLAFLFSGYIAMYYWTEVKRFKRVLHFYFFMKQDKKSGILKLRDDILLNITVARSNIGK